MYSHIEKILFIKVEVPQKIFNKTLAKKINEIKVPVDQQWQEIVHRDNEFVRVTTQGSYIDLKIVKVFIDKEFVIRMGDIIDFDRQRNKTYLNKLTNETCTAETVQDAGLHFKLHIRHIRRIY